jgi:hypothetical protein
MVMMLTFVCGAGSSNAKCMVQLDQMSDGLEYNSLSGAAAGFVPGN